MHPFIDFEAGLEKLHGQVTMEKTIDREYASALASDLAYTLIDSHIRRKKMWPVDPEKLPDTHKLKKFIRHSIWPNASAVQAFGNHWRELPITQCFEVPEHIPPSTLYGDKSHSMQRSQVLDWVKNHRSGSIPSKKVLQTALQREATDIPSF